MPADQVEALLDRVFGADRRQRTAYAIRGNAAPIAALSFAIAEEAALLATIQCFPVCLRRDAGGVAPLVMVGPVAVVPERQGMGLGRALLEAVLAAAPHHPGGAALMLIGDAPYYGRFGFSAAQTGQWRAPGPIDPARLLARGGAVPAGPGLLGPAISLYAGAPPP